jgi:hypothetical protein
MEFCVAQKTKNDFSWARRPLYGLNQIAFRAIEKVEYEISEPGHP